MTPEQTAWQLLTEPPTQEAAPGPLAAPIPPPAIDQHPPEPPPKPEPWSLIGQAQLLQKSSEIEATRQAEDLRRRGALMTTPPQPLNLNEALGEVMKGRWIDLDEAARQEMERRQRRTPPGWMGDCGDEFSW